MRSLILMLTFCFCQLTEAQILTNGLNALGGQATANTTTVGALANRNAANQLYQQSLADEKAGMSSFPPNVGLLSKALKEAQDGVSADNQSHSMAQEAMQSTDTGANSGHYNASDYGAMNSSEITQMATSSSPLWPQVSSTLQGFGLSLTENKQYMNTPFGTFPTDATPDQMASVIKQMAQKFGLSGADVEKGIAAAQATATAIGQKALADAQQKAAALQAAKGGAVDDGSKGAGLGNSKDGANGSSKRKLAGEKTFDKLDKNGVDWDEQARQVNQFRDKLQDEMGVEPIWNKEDDLFKKIHEHYVMLDQQSVFLPVSTKQNYAIHP